MYKSHYPTGKIQFAGGFIDKVVAPQNVMEEVEKYANIITKNGYLAVTVLKTWGLPLQEALQLEREIVDLQVHGSKDAREGPKAFK